MNDHMLRERLLEAEPPNSELEGRYRERLQAITQHRITRGERAGLVAAVLGAAATIAWFIHLMAPSPAGHPRFGLLALRVGLVLAAALGAYAVNVLRLGTANLRRDLSAQLPLACILIMVVLLLCQGRVLPDPARGDQKMLIALAAWTIAGLPIFISHFMRTSEIKLRTDILRIELAVAELAERLPGRPQ